VEQGFSPLGTIFLTEAEKRPSVTPSLLRYATNDPVCHAEEEIPLQLGT
jgi:hypothetical protein